MKLPSSLFALGFLVPAVWAAGPAEPPAIARVEPPDWWAGHSINPVRLLLTGKHLGQAQVLPPSGFSVANVRASADQQYLFVDLHIPTGAPTGPVPLRVGTPAGEVTAPFALRPRLPETSRFAGFTTDDVIYLTMPDRFANGDAANDNPSVSPDLCDRSKPRHYHGGDLAGVVARMPYLRELGVTALWLTPWYDNVNHLNHQEKYTPANQRSAGGRPSTDYHGYGAVDFYGVEEHFGDLDKLRAFVAAAHRQGFKVIQDQVANHTGPYHPWVNAPPTPTWFNGSAASHLDNSWQTWTIAHTNPPADKLQSTLEGWFINILPDLNQNDPETATYLIQNSLWWVGVTGLDAIRQDTLPYVPRSYWARWTAALKREFPRLTILGEMWDGKPELVAFFQGGQTRFDGVDSGVETLFDFPLHYAIRDVFAKGAPMTKLAQVLAADTNYVNPHGLVTFLGLHDSPRFLHESDATLEGLQHAFTFLLTARGTPMIYYGDEIGMRGGGDPDNRRDFPGGWKEDPDNAFTASGRTTEQERVHAHVKKLLRLRQELSPLRRGEMVALPASEKTYAFARVKEKAGVVVAFNLSEQPAQMHLPLKGHGLKPTGTWTDRLGKLGRVRASGGNLNFTLPANSAAVLAP